MKIVKFKDGTYGIRRFNWLNTFNYDYVHFKVFEDKIFVYDNKLACFIDKDINLTTKTQVEVFEYVLWVEATNFTKKCTSVPDFCKHKDLDTVKIYFRIIKNKEYKNNIKRFDYGKSI